MDFFVCDITTAYLAWISPRGYAVVKFSDFDFDGELSLRENQETLKKQFLMIGLYLKRKYFAPYAHS